MFDRSLNFGEYRDIRSKIMNLAAFIAISGMFSHSLIASTIVDWFGSYSSASTPWEVHVREDAPPSFVYDGKNGIKSGIAPSGWLPNKGWFVFIASDSKLWAFDGKAELLLLNVSPEGSTMYSLHSLPLMPPQDVLERLPEAFREKVAFKFEKTEQIGAVDPDRSMP